MNVGDVQDRSSHQLRDAIRYNLPLIVIFAILGTAAGLGLAYLKPAHFTSSTTVIANQIVGNPYTPDSTSDTLEMLQTEAVAATSEEVVSGVVDELGINISPERLRQESVVTVPANTQALQITYSSDSPQLATEIVDAIAEQYLAQRRARAEGSIQQQVDSLTTQLVAAQNSLKQANSSQDPRATAIRASIIDIQGQISTANAQPTDPGRVLTPGLAPGGSEQRHFAVFGIIGLVFGLLAGVAIAIWRERRRDLVRSADDLYDYSFEAPVTVLHGTGLSADSLRHLRMRLAPQIRGQGSVALVGSTPTRSLATGVLLGRSFAESGTSVVLIDGTGTAPGHHDILGLEDKPGLAEALTSEELPGTFAIQENFGYLPAGADAQSASEHLVDEHARTIVDGLSKRHDLTLVVCMPLDNVEGEALAHLTEGVILLVELSKTSHFELGRALTSLNRQGLRLLNLFVLPRTR